MKLHRIFQQAVLGLVLTLTAKAWAQTEVVPVFTLALSDRLLSASCRGTGTDGQTQVVEVLNNGTIRATPYGTARCPQGFSDSWALPVASGAVFHHYYEDTAPRFSKLLRWQDGQVTELAELTHSGSGPARSELVKPLVGGVLYGIHEADFFADQKAYILDLSTGQSRLLIGSAANGSSCTLVVPGLDRPYVAGPQDAGALTVLDSSCPGSQQNTRLRFVVDGDGRATARPDLQGCTAFSALGGALFGFCPFTEADGMSFSRLLRISVSSSEELARYNLRDYNPVTTHYLRAMGGHVVYAIQATARDVDNRVSDTALEVYRSEGVSAPVRIDSGSSYRNLVGRGSATAQFWALAVNDASGSSSSGSGSGSGNFSSGTLYYDVAGGTARFTADSGFNATVNPSDLGADLPNTDFTFFAAETPAAEAGGTPRGVEPWVIERGTLSSRLLADLGRSPTFGASNNGNSRPKQFTAFSGAMYFWAQNAGSDRGLSSLYRSSGQTNDPVLVFPFEGSDPPSPPTTPANPTPPSNPVTPIGTGADESSAGAMPFGLLASLLIALCIPTRRR